MQSPPTTDLLNLPHVRPRFQAETSIPSVQIQESIQAGLNKIDAPCKGRVNRGYVTLYMPETEQHYWSPQLSLVIEETERGGSLLRGLYGPRPAVWTMFVFFYAILGFGTVVVTIIGFSRRSLDLPAPILWLVPILALLFGSIYTASYFGQRLGHDQMDILHDFLAESTGLTIEEEYA